MSGNLLNLVNMTQGVLLIIALGGAVLFGLTVGFFQAWKASARRRVVAINAGAGVKGRASGPGWAWYHREFSPRYDRIAQPFSNLPLVLGWSTGISVGLFIIIRVILSYMH